MATMKKKIISIILIAILSISLILGDTYKVKAMATAGVVLSGLTLVTAAVIAAEQSEDYQNWYENSYRPRYQDCINQLFQRVGFITGTEKIANFITTFGGDPIQNARIWIAQESGVNENQITDNEVKQALYNMYKNCNIDSNNDSFTFSSNLQSYTQYIANGIIDNSGFKYCYSFDVLKSVQNFSDGANFSAMRRFLSSSQYKYNFWCPNQFVCTNDDNLAFVVQADQTTRYQCYYYNFETWQQISLSNLSDVAIYEYDSNLSEYTLNNNASLSNNIEYLANLAKTKDELVYYNYQSYLLTLNKNTVHKVYMSLADLKADTQGQAPYYISKTWNNFSTSNSTYTIDNSNVNYITYGDVISYVNSFNTENGYYPDPQQIQIIIDNNNPDDGSGGGGSGGNNGGEDISGGSSSATATANNEGINININNNHNLNIGGSTVSGNGSGTSSGIGDIFGFLSGIGEALASLVKNLGTALADLLKSLAEVINDIVVGIPDIFSGLINIVFGGLPDDLKSVIILGITVMVVYGLVKMIRG